VFQFAVRKSRCQPGLSVERTGNTVAQVPGQEVEVSILRIQSPLLAKVTEPAATRFHMADLVTQDHLQHGHGVLIPPGTEFLHDSRRHVQAPGLHHPRHQRHSQKGILRRLLRQLPKTAVGRKITVVVSELPQPIPHQPEVEHLLSRYPEPVFAERLRHLLEAHHRIQRQVDGIELDVGDGVKHGRTPLGGTQPASGHFPRRYQAGTNGPSGLEGARQPGTGSPIEPA